MLTKTPLCDYTNAQKVAKSLGFDLADRDGDEIHISTFNNLANSLHDLVQVVQVYTVSNGTIKVPNLAYNHLNHAFEILLFFASTVSQFIHDDQSIPSHSFRFKPIISLNLATLNSIVDVIGVVNSILPTSIIHRGDSFETPKKTISL